MTHIIVNDGGRNPIIQQTLTLVVDILAIVSAETLFSESS